MCVYNKRKYILILGEEPVQGIDDKTLTVEAKYPTNFTKSEKRFVLSLHYKRSSSFLYVNATKVYQFIAKNPGIEDYVLCLGNISNNFATNKLKKIGLTGVAIFFSVDFHPIDTNDILDVRK